MDTFQALADPTRRNIIEILAAKGQLSASDIYDQFDVSNPAISQHLKVLRDSDLVSVEKKSQQRIYRINAKKISELEKWIHQLTKQWNQRFDRLEKVLDQLKRKEVKHGRTK